MQVTPVEFPAEHVAFLQNEELYTPAEVAALALYQGMHAARSSAEAGQEICNWVSNRNNVALTFQRWHDGDIVAVNAKGKRYAITGSWVNPGFILRGVIKEKRNGKGFNWLINGQANRNAEQVAHYTEMESVSFPEFEPIIAAYKAAMEAASARRGERSRKYVLVDSRTYNRVTEHALPLEMEMTGREYGQRELRADVRYVPENQVKTGR